MFHLKKLKNTPHPMGLLWKRAQTVADSSAWKHTVLSRDRHGLPVFYPVVPPTDLPQNHALDNVANYIG